MNLNALLNTINHLSVSEEVQESLKGKTVLITGAAGSIGSEISKILIEKCDCKLILLDQSETGLYDLQQLLIDSHNKFDLLVGNICDKKRMRSIFQQFEIDVLYHAAAYKHVPLMESNSYEAVRVNIEGTKIIADLALQFEVNRFVMISTDKAVNPTNVMGATKRIAELYINCLSETNSTKFITTRFGNVIGSNGSVLPLFQSQIKFGGPLTVTHKEMERYFMTVSEACQLVLEAGVMGSGGEIFVFDMGESVNIFELAKNVIESTGLKYPDDIDIKITGLRTGEKIKEELLTKSEVTSSTQHQRINIAIPKKIDKDSTKKEIQDLISINKELNSNKTVLKMKEIVPEFISNNSNYEALDK